MTRLRLKYINVVRKSGGRIYHYFRRPGFARVYCRVSRARRLSWKRTRLRSMARRRSR
jgi:hypothetical protein